RFSGCFTAKGEAFRRTTRAPISCFTRPATAATRTAAPTCAADSAPGKVAPMQRALGGAGGGEGGAPVGAGVEIDHVRAIEEGLVGGGFAQAGAAPFGERLLAGPQAIETAAARGTVERGQPRPLGLAEIGGHDFVERKIFAHPLEVDPQLAFARQR